MSRLDETKELVEAMSKLAKGLSNECLSSECVLNTELSIISAFIGDIAISLATIADKEG